MYGDQPVMKAHRQFVWLIGFMIDRVLRVVDSFFGLNEVRFDTKIAVAVTILPRPAPDAIEHPAMQAERERFAENTALAGKGPAIGFRDVLLLEFVELARAR